MEDRFCKEETFEGIKGGLAGGGPIPREIFLSEVEERASDVGIVRDESSVEIGETKERADIFHLGGGWPTGDSIEFDRVHGQLAGFDDHAKVFYLVEGGIGGVDEEVIHIDNEPSFGDHIVEGVVHEALEGSGGIGEAEEHDGGLEESLVSDEGRLPLMTVFNLYVVIPPPYVELGENRGVSQFVHEV